MGLVLRYFVINAVLCVLCLVSSSNTFATNNHIKFKITGASKGLERNIQLHLSKYEVDLERLDTEQQLTDIVTKAMQALGYYEASIQLNIVSEKEILIAIKQGERLKWSTPDIQLSKEVRSIPEMLLLIKGRPLQKDKRVSHDDYESTKKKLLDICHRHGYLEAEYKKRGLVVDLELKTAKAILHLDCGKRFHVKSIVFIGSILGESLLNLLISDSRDNSDSATNNGYYHRQQLRQIYRNLSNSGYFANINVERETGQEADLKLLVQLKDKSRHQILTGVGFGTDTGPRARAQWELPVLNPKGHSISSKLEVSHISQTLSTRYRIPTPHPLYDFNEYQFGLMQSNIADSETQILSLVSSWHYRYRNQWHRVFSLEWEREWSKIQDEPEQVNSVLFPTLNLGLDRKNESTGNQYRLWASVLSGQTALGSDISFFRLHVGAKTLVPIVGKHQAVLRTEFGAIDTSRIDEVPLSQRFFTGGDQTVRGFKYESIGRRNTLTTSEGGRYLNIASVEYNYRMKPKWAMALFMDAGRAFENPSESFYNSAGLGLRWYSLLGTVRLDVAHPVGRFRDQGPRFHLFVGTDL